MTNLRRTLAATAAAVALAAGIIAGSATSALAQSTGFPPVGPNPSGPSVPPLPPGDYRPVVQFPACSAVLFPSSYAAARYYYPTFGNLANVAGQYGAADATLRGVITSAARTQTCTFGTSTGKLYVTETAISSATATTLNAWYAAHNSGSGLGGPGTMPGTRSDNWYTVGTSEYGFEFAAVSPDGWWITTRQVGISVLPALGQDAWQRFMDANPWRS